MRPTNTLKPLLVHPKNKKNNLETTSTTEQHKSAITDHVAQENHLIDWEETKNIDRDSNPFTRKVREAIQIRKRGTKALNRDDGLHSLSIMYTIHCCLELNFLGTRLPLQELTSAGKAVENTCDQDLSPRGRS